MLAWGAQTQPLADLQGDNSLELRGDRVLEAVATQELHSARFGVTFWAHEKSLDANAVSPEWQKSRTYGERPKTAGFLGNQWPRTASRGTKYFFPALII